MLLNPERHRECHGDEPQEVRHRAVTTSSTGGRHITPQKTRETKLQQRNANYMRPVQTAMCRKILRSGMPAHYVGPPRRPCVAGRPLLQEPGKQRRKQQTVIQNPQTCRGEDEDGCSWKAAWTCRAGANAAHHKKTAQNPRQGAPGKANQAAAMPLHRGFGKACRRLCGRPAGVHIAESADNTAEAHASPTPLPCRSSRTAPNISSPLKNIPQSTHLGCLQCRYWGAPKRKPLRRYSLGDGDPQPRFAKHMRTIHIEHPQRASTPIQAPARKISCETTQTLGSGTAGPATPSTATTSWWTDSVHIRKSSSALAPNVACRQR